MRDKVQFGARAIAPAVIFRRTIAGRDAVAGDDDGVGIAPAGTTDRACPAFMRAGQRAIGCGAAIGNAVDRGAEIFPTLCGERDKRQIECAASSVKIFADLAGCDHRRAIGRSFGRADGVSGFITIRVDPHRMHRVGIPGDDDRANRRCQRRHMRCISHARSLTANRPMAQAMRRCAVKIKINIDCTPVEARSFLGLPDVSPLHDIYLSRMKTLVEQGVTPDAVSEMVRGWGTMGDAGLSLVQSLFGQIGGGLAGSGAKAAPKDAKR